MPMSVGTLLGQLRLDNDQYLRGLRNTETATRASARNSAGEVEKASKRVEAARSKEEDAAGKVRVEESKLEELRRRSGVTSDRLTQAEERLAKARRDYAVATRDSHRAIEDQSRAVGRLNEALTAAARPRTAKVNVDLDTRAVEQARLAVDRAAAARTATINAQADRAAAAAAGRTLDEAARARQARIDAAVRGEQEANARLAEVARDRLSRVNVNAETAAAESALNFVARNRASSVDAQAQTAAAEGALNFTARNRASTINANADTFAAETALNTTARNRATTIAANADTLAAEGALNFTARNRPSTVNAHADVLGAENALNFTARNRGTTIAANADVFAAEAALNFTARNRSLIMSAHPDTLAAEANLNFTARARQSVINANADTFAAENLINFTARPRSSTINVDADVGAALVKLGLVDIALFALRIAAQFAQGAIQFMFGAVQHGSQLATAAISGFITLASQGIFGVIAVVVILVATIATLGAALIFVTGLAAILVGWVGLLGAAVLGAGGAFAIFGAAAFGVLQTTNLATENLKAAWDRFINTVRPIVEGVLNNALNLVTGALDRMAPIVEKVAGVFNGWLGGMERSLGGGAIKRFFDWLDGPGARQLDLIGQIAGQVFNGLIGLLEAFGPHGEWFLRWILDIATRFARWAEDLRNNPEFQKWMNFVKENGPRIVDIIVSIIGILTSLATMILPWAGLLIRAFQMVINIIEWWATVFRIAKDGISSGIFMLAAIIADKVKGIIDWFNGGGGAMERLRTIASIVTGVIGGAFSGLAGAVGLAIGGIIGGLNNGGGAMDRLRGVSDTVTGAIGRAWDWLKGIIGGAINGIIGLLDRLAGAFRGAMGMATDAAKSIAGAVGSAVSGGGGGGGAPPARAGGGVGGGGRLGKVGGPLGSAAGAGQYLFKQWSGDTAPNSAQPINSVRATRIGAADHLKHTVGDTWYQDRFTGQRVSSVWKAPRVGRGFLHVNSEIDERGNRIGDATDFTTSEEAVLGRRNFALGGIARYAAGGWKSQAKAEGLRPMSGSAAKVVPPNTWRVIGDRARSDEAFIPINRSTRSQSLLAMTAQNMGFGLSKMAAGGIMPVTEDSPIATKATPNQMRVVGDRSTGREAFIPVDGSRRSQSVLEGTARKMGFSLTAMAKGGLLGDEAAAAAGGKAAAAAGGGGGLPIDPEAIRLLQAALKQLEESLNAVGVSLDTSNMSFQGLNTTLGTMNATLTNSGLEWTNFGTTVGAAATAMQAHLSGMSTGMNAAGTASSLATSGMSTQWSGLGGTVGLVSSGMGAQMGGVAANAGGMALGVGGAATATAASWGALAGGVGFGAASMQGSMAGVAGAAGGLALGFGGATGNMGFNWGSLANGLAAGSAFMQGTMAGVAGSAGGMALGFGGATGNMAANWGGLGAALAGGSAFMQGSMAGVAGSAGLMAGGFGGATNAMGALWNGFVGALLGGAGLAQAAMPPVAGSAGLMAAGFGGATGAMGGAWNGFVGGFQGGAGAVQGAMPPVVGGANAMAGGFGAATAGMGAGWGAFVGDFTGRANDMAARMGGVNNDTGAMGAHWAATARGMTDAWNGHSGAFHGTTDAISGRIGGLNNDVGGMGGHFGATSAGMGGAWQGFSDGFEGNRVRGSNNIAALGTDFGNLGNHWGATSNGMGGAWQGFGDHVRGVFDGRVAPTFNDLRNLLGETENSFGVTVGNIGRIWDGIKPATAKPVNFMISEVYNKGVVGAWNKVAVDFLKQPALAGHANIAENKQGGVIPGYTPGRDNQLSWVSGGEAIMRPEWTRAIGPGAVNMMNRIARTGGVRGVKRFFGEGQLPSEATTPKIARGKAGRESIEDYYGGRIKIPSSVREFPYIPAFEEGGIPQKVKDAQNWARGEQGKPYIWGGVGPAGYDCSGWTSAIENFLTNRPLHRRNHTTHNFSNAGGAGYRPGLESAWTIGVSHASVGHMAGTLGGMNTESGSGHGPEIGGRALGATDQSFPIRLHLPQVGGMFIPGVGGGISFDPKEMVKRWWNEENTKGFMGTAKELPGKFGDNMFAKGVGEPLAGKKKEAGVPWVEHHADAIVPHIMQWIMSQIGSVGPGPGGDVERWRPVVEAALRWLNLPMEWAGVTLNQIRTESGGNPRAINLWDSNAARGTPSGGLLQTIAPTFAAHRDPRLPGDMWDPFANIVASMRYAMSRYGSLPAAYRGVGYDSGGWLEPGMTPSANDTGKPEAVLTSEQWRAVMGGGLKTEKHYHLTVYSTNSETNLREQYRRMEIMDGF